MSKYKICIIGAGSYGTALAYVLSYTGHSVIIYSRDEEQVNMINKFHINPKRFPKKRLSDNVISTNILNEAMQDIDLIFHCIPCQSTPSFLQKIGNIIPKNIPFILTSKGLYSETGQLLSDILPLYLDKDNIAYLSGPSFAKEMIDGTPVSVVVASEKISLCKRIQKMISTDIFRIYITDDIIGLEVGGALKNPIAIGVGIAMGLGYGKSTIAALITIGCSEMARISKKMGGKSETLAGLSGIGDLMLTCYSPLSRNNRFGLSIGNGKSIKDSIEEIGEVVEGYPTLKHIQNIISNYDLHLPFFSSIYEILYCSKDPYIVFLELLKSQPGIETF